MSADTLYIILIYFGAAIGFFIFLYRLYGKN